MTPKQRLIKRLKKGWLTASEWAQTTGSVKASTRIGELIREGHNVIKQDHVLSSGTVVKQYRILEMK